MDILNCCDICGEHHPTELCPELGLNIVQTELDQLSTRARLTLPGFVQVVDNGNGLVGVVAKETIPNKTQLGPYEAKRTTHIFEDSGFFTLKVIARDGTTVCLDTTDETECNWLCLVRAATLESNKNCMAYQLGGNIFYNTTREITPGEELLVWYAPHFARKLGKPPEPDGVTRVLLGHRIEPLTSDLLLDFESASVYEAEETNENLEQPAVDTVQPQPNNSDRPTGEIRKAFYCPRCGNTFETQTEMVHHLREHVLTSSNTPRRGRGRPRKYGEEVRHSMMKKSSVTVDSEEPMLNFQKPTKTYSRKRKLVADSDDYTKNYEEGDDEDDFADNINEKEDKRKDSEYTPKVDVSVAGTREMPKRTNRGKHSKYDPDFVYQIVKKEMKEEPIDSVGNDIKEVKVRNTTSKAGNSVNDKGTGGGSAKKGRGRPKKIPYKLENSQKEQELAGVFTQKEKEPASIFTQKEKEPVGVLSLEAVQESIVALKSLDKDVQNTDDQSKVYENKYENDCNSHNDSSNNENKSENDSNPKKDAGNNDLFESKVDNECENVNIAENVARNDMEDLNEEEVPEKVEETVEVFESVTYKVLEVTDKINEIEEINESQGIENVVNDKSILVTEEPKETESHENEFNDRQGKVNDDNLPEKEDAVEKILIKTEDKSSLVVMFDEADDGSYRCDICDERFTNELDAISHYMQHDRKGAVSCKICHDNFDNIEALLEHRKECIASNVDILNDDDVTKSKNQAEYVCDICQQAFKTAQYLYRHLVIHTDVFQCEQCSKTFSRKDSMQKHILKCCPSLAEKYKIYYCEVCFRVFSKESGKRRHIEKCKSVQCKNCSKIFVSQADLAIHTCKMFELDDSAKYCCGRCSKAFQSLYYLKQHQQLHDNHNSCERCGKSFSSKEELDGHKSLCETLEGIRLYGTGKCSICFETFSNTKAFRNHFMSHTHPYQCDKCNKRFLRISTLDSHDCEILTDAVCNVCQKTFKNQANLEKHIKENGCMRYQCSACNEQFRSKGIAKDHNCIIEATEGIEAEIVSINNVKEICPKCGKSFSSKSNLTKHMLLHGEKKFGCPHCPKYFHLDVYLKEHITCVHYKIFKYQCNECGRLLKSKTGLIAHTRIFHTKNVEVFPCTKCKKVFKQRGNLKSHMFSHIKERNFKCDICIKTFKYPDQLSRHKLEHKLLPRLKCAHCEKEFLRSYDLKRHLQIYHSGYIFVCGICSARCGHRHTLTRHYKRKHPESAHFLYKQGYVDNLLKHVSEVFDQATDQGSTVETKCIDLNEKVAENAEKIIDNTNNSTIQIPHSNESSEGLSVEEAEALHCLSLGCATAHQIQLLKEKGLFIQGENGIYAGQDSTQIQEQGQVIIPQDSYILGSNANEQGQFLEGSITIPAEIDNIGMVHTSDSAISINEMQGIPQQSLEVLDKGDSQIVILQIIDPDSQELQGEIIQVHQDQHGNIQLNEEQQEKLLKLNEPHTQIIHLNQEQQEEIMSLNETVFESSTVYHNTELDQNGSIQTVVVDSNNAVIGQARENQAEDSEFTLCGPNTEPNVVEKLDSLPIISLEGGDPNIQAPMVYSQDVTCSDVIE